MLAKQLCYLASPYTHSNPEIMDSRHKKVCEIAAFWKSQGFHLYCPIAETEAVAKYGKIQNTNWEYWRDDDLLKLDRCDQLWICLMDGWKSSRGIRGEIKYAIQTKKPILLVDGLEYVAAVNYSAILELLNVQCVDDLND